MDNSNQYDMSFNEKVFRNVLTSDGIEAAMVWAAGMLEEGWISSAEFCEYKSIAQNN